MVKWLQSRAIFLQAVIHSGIALGVAFGMHVNVQQLAAISALTAAVLSLIVGKFVSSNPNS